MQEQHPTAEDLRQYALGDKKDKKKNASMEVHLLICSACRQIVQTADQDFQRYLDGVTLGVV